MMTVRELIRILQDANQASRVAVFPESEWSACLSIETEPGSGFFISVIETELSEEDEDSDEP